MSGRRRQTGRRRTLTRAPRGAAPATSRSPGQEPEARPHPASRRKGAVPSWIGEAFSRSAALHRRVLEEHGAAIDAIARRVASTVTSGRTIFFCGNGGSAAEAQHFAAELVGRFTRERRGLPAIALTTDSSVLTALGNDYGFERIFARQIEALGRKGDLLIVLTTSGRSANIRAAVETARRIGLEVVGLTGAKGEAFARRCDLALVVPSDETPRIQEIHLLVGHLMCEAAESQIVNREGGRGA